ncbi:MAG: M20/M25/M40 family metallo-hydrolase, partial [Propionibacteriaceae bacterium]|nr:M20/M25/M40 family metallo-hydrolase [Propionibacteriaceae bacterium]
FDGKPPVGVKVFIEGEEEMGSPSMDAILDAYPEETRADVYVIADSMNWAVGKPALTTSLRGLVDAVVTVSTLETGVARLLATLHDDEGNVAIEGLVRDPDPAIDYDEDTLRAESGVLDGVQWFGDGHRAAQMWTRPAASVLAIDATPVKDASNTLIASARAKVSVRIAPTEDPANAEAALRDHLLKHAPWGAKVEVKPERGGSGSRVSLDDDRARAAVSALKEAFGVDPVEMGVGGSIPIVAEFMTRNPGCLVLLTAVVDPTSRMHGIDESLDLGDFGKAAVAEALLLEKLA